MRNLLRILLIVFCLPVLTACSKQSPANIPASVPEEAALNEVDFEVIEDDEKLPPNMENSINILKANRGFLIYDYNGSYYIAVFSGKKNTGGYEIKVLSVEDNKGKANILVEESAPKQGSIVTQAITYPYTVVKVSGITSYIAVKNAKGEEFEKLMKNGEMH